MTALAYQDFLKTASRVLLDPQYIDRRNAVLIVNFERLSRLDGVIGFANVDEIVRQASERLGAALNSEDLVGVTGRYQISCLLANLLTDAHAMLAAHKILRILKPSFKLGVRNVILSSRIGIALNNNNNFELDQLMSNASSALYQAKLRQETIKIFVEDAENQLFLEVELWSDLEQAIEAGELYLGYQPKYNFTSGKIESTEALLRWNHPKHGPIGPDKLIKVAEGTELMSKLTLWVFQTALRECSAYRRAGLDAGVSINFSADDLRDPELTELVSQGLDLWEVPPGNVTIELTETAVMEDHPGSLETLHELKNMGLKLAMDDFGTGYSSLARILKLPLDEVKIDMIFVKNMTTQRSHARIVDSMIRLGHRLDLHVVAEGVEDMVTYERLRALGCDTIQGYLIGKAMPLAELIEAANSQPYSFLESRENEQDA